MSQYDFVVTTTLEKYVYWVGAIKGDDRYCIINRSGEPITPAETLRDRVMDWHNDERFNLHAPGSDEWKAIEKRWAA